MAAVDIKVVDASLAIQTTTVRIQTVVQPLDPPSSGAATRIIPTPIWRRLKP